MSSGVTFLEQIWWWSPVVREGVYFSKAVLSLAHTCPVFYLAKSYQLFRNQLFITTFADLSTPPLSPHTHTACFCLVWEERLLTSFLVESLSLNLPLSLTSYGIMHKQLGLSQSASSSVVLRIK